MFLNHGVAQVPFEKIAARYEPNPARFMGSTSYNREFSVGDQDDLRQRYLNAKENNRRRHELRDQMRAGTIVLSKSALNKSTRDPLKKKLL